jgi:hypothetical protein
MMRKFLSAAATDAACDAAAVLLRAVLVRFVEAGTAWLQGDCERAIIRERRAKKSARGGRLNEHSCSLLPPSSSIP